MELGKINSLSLSTMSSFDIKVVMTKIFKLIHKLSNMGGEIFGEFITDVIVPYLEVTKGNVPFINTESWLNTTHTFSSIDVLLKNKTELPKFTKMSYLEPIDNKELNIKSFYLVHYGTRFTRINLYLENLVHDFDVNTVTYKLDQQDNWISNSPNSLIKQIFEKRAYMLPGYYGDMIETKYSNKQEFHSGYEKKIKTTFLDKGWTIHIPMMIDSNYFKQ